MQNDLCELIVTAPDPEWLVSITRQLVIERLCASAHNVTPIRSLYWWEGELIERVEGRAELHTQESLVPEIIARIKSEHPYKVPGIWVTPITGGNPEYLQWIADETRQE